jgi:hypothetical protein
MRRVLHILSRPDDELSREIISSQQAGGKVEVIIVDLTSPSLDYGQLLQEIFKADSIEVW